MKASHCLFALTTVSLLNLSPRCAAAAPAAAGSTTGSQPAGPLLAIRVDPRVELVSLIFRLAGNPEYSQSKVETYTRDVSKEFGQFRDHDAVALARELRQRRGISFDAVMSMAVHLNDAQELKLLVPLDPWPDGLDRRWTARDAERFLSAARRFVSDTGFLEFVARHRPLYETTESRMKTLMQKEGHLEWFQEYFGERPQATFTMIPGLLNGGCCYGVHCQELKGPEHLYCILGVWRTDDNGLPEFTHDMLGTVVHEFGHSYANPIVDRHEAELKEAGQQLFGPVAAKMRAQAYGEPQTLLRESLVRACEVRYASRYDGQAAARRVIANNKGRGFLWIEELSNLLAKYETNRNEYATLEAFSPDLVSFFTEYARTFAEKQKTLAARRPKVLSMIPKNGAKEVDPDTTCIQVTFDRPMRDRSWSLVGSGPHCPETTGKPHYDESGKVWTVPVKIKPNWSYQFMLNSADFEAFCSKEGVPLEPVRVQFKTRQGR
jgi:hypothetical protein